MAWHNATTNEMGISVNNISNTAPTTIAPVDNNIAFRIGATGVVNEYWDGAIDEVAFYKRVLTSAERTWLYNNGNGRTYADLSLTPPTSTTYAYGDTAHKHAVTTLSTGETYTYDTNGNTLAPGASAGVIARVENGQTYTQTFDIENRLASVTLNGQTTQFIYDGDGNLVKKINPGGSNTLYYVLKDHLGSAGVVTDSTSVIGGEQRYYPYGETRLTTGTIYTDKLFTGQREMTGLGIYHYGARFYSHYLNHFTQLSQSSS